MKDTILLLGGTAEAREFAERFDRSDFRLVASLAGATREPRNYPCEIRVGGFGGVEAMAAWIANNRVGAIVDATHPFATQISQNACKAAARRDVVCIGLVRAPWELRAGWREFEDIASIASALPSQARVFLTSGRHGIDAFSQREDIICWLRTIEPVRGLPTHIHSIEGRPPFPLVVELATMKDAQITHLVTKNAGGVRAAKLEAAEQLGLTVFSVAMPPSPHALTVNSVERALAWSRGFSRLKKT